jgi:hypothetical protein
VKALRSHSLRRGLETARYGLGLRFWNVWALGFRTGHRFGWVRGRHEVTRAGRQLSSSSLPSSRPRTLTTRPGRLGVNELVELVGSPGLQGDGSHIPQGRAPEDDAVHGLIGG